MVDSQVQWVAQHWNRGNISTSKYSNAHNIISLAYLSTKVVKAPRKHSSHLLPLSATRCHPSDTASLPNRPSSASMMLCSNVLLLLRDILSKKSSSFWFRPKNSVTRRSGSSSLFPATAAMPMIEEFYSIGIITSSYCPGNQASNPGAIIYSYSPREPQLPQQRNTLKLHIEDCPLGQLRSARCASTLMQ